MEVYEQKIITTYLTFSLPMNVIYSNKMKEQWVYEHFTELYLMRAENGYIWLDYLEDLYFPKDVLDYSFIPAKNMRNIQDILEFTKEKIDQENYLTIYIDEYYYENSEYYKKEHRPLQVFTYGYDDNEGLMYSIGFFNDGTFGKLNILYDDYKKGYEECIANYEKFAIWVELYYCLLMKVKDPQEKYKFQPSIFLSHLKNYLLSYGDESQLRPEIQIEMGNKAIYGIKVHDEVLKNLYRLLDGDYVMDYRQIHLIEEHKRLMLDKIKYISECYKLDEKIESKIQELGGIVNEYKDARLTYMKYMLIENDMKTINGQLKNQDAIRKIINIFESERLKEELLLKEVYELIKEGIGEDNLL